jgi:hypothetical protein
MAIYHGFYTKWQGGPYPQSVSETPLTRGFAARMDGGVPPLSVELLSTSPQVSAAADGIVTARREKGG